ncbi:hypothetical protein EJ08DRAFT_432060 [Tothia fuscella]|uniref:Uncharacterized protein n=1 Tax=Tothia fuscella TaxID=1048955 RepID=A0A9P4U2H1_9PEZI|nr:hypothetical protein EJ08DRAFT_432060 [Tothia fuscella]
MKLVGQPKYGGGKKASPWILCQCEKMRTDEEWSHIKERDNYSGFLFSKVQSKSWVWLHSLPSSVTNHHFHPGITLYLPATRRQEPDYSCLDPHNIVRPSYHHYCTTHHRHLNVASHITITTLGRVAERTLAQSCIECTTCTRHPLRHSPLQCSIHHRNKESEKRADPSLANYLAVYFAIAVETA